MNRANLPEITWCARCVYPSSSAVTLTFDEHHVCSGCRVHDQKKEIDWDERLEWLLEEVEPYRKSTGYECVIGVSGGKDSYYQTHFVKEKLGLKPLLVTYNGNNYLDVGWRNMLRMKEVFNVDHLVISPSVDALIRLNRLCFRRMGDMNWQNHAGIATVPMKTAVQFNIPLVFWGEHGWTDLGGMHSMHDLVEYTARYRKDQFLRGYDWYDMVGDAEDPVAEHELEWCKYPDDDEIQRVGLRGIFIGNYDPWDANAHAELVMETYGWEPSPEPFERTYRRMSNLDDRYENGIHDYLKYVKFGYGRATDHASKDIRLGYLTRAEGIEKVRAHDHVKSSDLYHWLDYVGRDEAWFDRIADGFRDPRVWIQGDDGRWHKRNIWDNGRMKVGDIRPEDVMSGQRAAMQKDIDWLARHRDEFVPVACPACAADRTEVLYDKYGLTHRRCLACRTQYVSPRPDASLLERFYADSENYRYWATHVFPASKDARREMIFRPRAEIVADLAQRSGLENGVLVEVGAAYGLFCDEVRRNGLFSRIIGIEPTPDLAEICRDMGFEVIESSFEHASLPVAADVIASFEVIEHLFSPESFMTWCFESLAEGGHVLLTCPNIAGFETVTLGAVSDTVDHEHINLFTPDSLRLLAERVGFVDVEIVTPGRLDVEIVRDAVRQGTVSAEDVGPFVADIVASDASDASDSSDDRAIGDLFQNYLVAANRSSNMRLTARRPDGPGPAPGRQRGAAP